MQRDIVRAITLDQSVNFPISAHENLEIDTRWFPYRPARARLGYWRNSAIESFAYNFLFKKYCT